MTTFPVVKLPIHMTYLLYLWQVSPRLTKTYLHMALTACRVLGIKSRGRIEALVCVTFNRSPSGDGPWKTGVRVLHLEVARRLMSGFAAILR